MRSATTPPRLAVIGAGAWGTAIAQLLAGSDARVLLWARRPELAASLAATREHHARLPGMKLAPQVEVTADPERAAGVDAAFVAVPSAYLPGTLRAFSPPRAYVSCSKGLRGPELRRLSQVIAEAWPDSVPAALSGPNLAGEVAAGQPAAAVVASPDVELAAAAQRWLQGPTFRVYTSADLPGVELGGALKNVIALAAGMCDGLALGENAKATIVTRGLAEIVRLGQALGGQRETFYGLSGLGDLVATCAGLGSRNRTAGERVALGADLAALERSGITAEGIPTVAAVHSYAERTGLQLPIAAEVYRVIYERKDPRRAIADLMARELKPEW